MQMWETTDDGEGNIRKMQKFQSVKAEAPPIARPTPEEGACNPWTHGHIEG